MLVARSKRTVSLSEVVNLLAGLARGELRHIDCSHIKVHHHGTNPCGGQAQQAIGRSKGGINTKLAAIVDADGRAVALCLAPGNRHDLKAAGAALGAGASLATRALMGAISGRNCTGSGRGSASPGCAADASPCPSLAATTVAATGWKTSSPDSSDSAAWPHVTTSSPSPSLASCSSWR